MSEKPRHRVDQGIPVSWVQNVQPVQAVQNVWNDLNYLNGWNSDEHRPHFPPEADQPQAEPSIRRARPLIVA
jgi:hypothetical protein